MTEIDHQALAREIAMRMAPDALLDAEDVAAWFKVAPRYVTEELAKVPGFQKAVRVPRPGGGKGHPRWPRAQIAAYIDTLTGTKPSPAGGRPRRNHLDD